MFLILTMFASPPVGMLAYMLKVAEGWPPTRPRLSREDRQRLNQGTALSHSVFFLFFRHT